MRRVRKGLVVGVLLFQSLHSLFSGSRSSWCQSLGGRVYRQRRLIGWLFGMVSVRMAYSRCRWVSRMCAGGREPSVCRATYLFIDHTARSPKAMDDIKENKATTEAAETDVQKQTRKPDKGNPPLGRRLPPIRSTPLYKIKPKAVLMPPLRGSIGGVTFCVGLHSPGRVPGLEFPSSLHPFSIVHHYFSRPPPPRPLTPTRVHYSDVIGIGGVSTRCHHRDPWRRRGGLVAGC